MALNQVTLNTWQKQDERISTGSLKKYRVDRTLYF